MVETNKGRILIVDDEDVVRESLNQWFDSEGYAVNVASSGKDALTTVAQAQFDLALLDIKMPGMDGIELQQHLVDADPDLTIVIMTGYGTGLAAGSGHLPRLILVSRYDQADFGRWTFDGNGL